MRGFYDAAYIVSRVREKERTLKGRERNGGLRTMLNGDDRRGEGGSEEGEGVGGGGSGDVLAKVTAGNAVYVRRSKVACRVAGSLLSLSLPSPSCPLGCHHPLSPPAVSIHSSVHPSLSLSVCVCVCRCLSFSHSGPRGTAQTAGMHQMHRADRYPSPFYRFHLFTSAVCLSLSLLPVSPSQSFVSFFSGRLLRLRGPLSHPLHRFAAAVATPGYGPLL